MLSSFFPADRLESYRTSPYKDRIDRIGQRLVEQRYHHEVTAQHLREWLRVTRYLQEQELRLPLALKTPEVEQYVADRVVGLSASRTRFVWAAVRIFLDADEHGYCRRRIGRVPQPVPSWFRSALGEYTEFLCSHRGLAARTVRQAAVMAGSLPRDLSVAVPPPRQFKQRGLRDALTEREVTRLLNGVDRSSPIGRRDYAVLLLAARYGLRPCDLRQLRLDAVDWREHVLSLTQAKTGRILTLPLLPDVADALISYLRHGRPATASRYVFVRHKAPFEPFVAANNLATIMRQALQRVGLHQREGRRGLYLLRYTLACRMLASGSPLKRIGDVLGHASTDATMEYASVDLTALRRVAITEEEVRP